MSDYTHQNSQMLEWLESQIDQVAHCAKSIIIEKSTTKSMRHISDILDYLAKKAETSKAAGMAYLEVEKIVSVQ